VSKTVVDEVMSTNTSDSVETGCRVKAPRFEVLLFLERQ
jgi:hypothetical protein